MPALFAWGPKTPSRDKELEVGSPLIALHPTEALICQKQRAGNPETTETDQSLPSAEHVTPTTGTETPALPQGQGLVSFKLSTPAQSPAHRHVTGSMREKEY